MSRLEIFTLLHSEVLRILEDMGQNMLAVEVERMGMNHDIYNYLDRRFSMYFSDYGGINCRVLRERIEQNRDKVVKELLPKWIKEYVNTYKRFDKTRGKTPSGFVIVFDRV